MCLETCQCPPTSARAGPPSLRGPSSRTKNAKMGGVGLDEICLKFGRSYVCAVRPLGGFKAGAFCAVRHYKKKVRFSLALTEWSVLRLKLYHTEQELCLDPLARHPRSPCLALSLCCHYAATEDSYSSRE